MKTKNLVILVVVALALAALAYLKSRRSDAADSPSIAAGAKVLPELDKPENLNRIADIAIRTATATTRVAKVNGKWVAPGLFNYPAKFDQVSRFLMTLSELKVGQVVLGGDSLLGDLGLVPPEKASTSNDVPSGTLVSLRDEAGKTVAELLAGKTRQSRGDDSPMGMGGFPNGRYVLAGNQAVLVTESLTDLSTDSGNWVDKQIADVGSWDAESVKLTRADGSSVEITKPEGATDWKLDGLKDTEELDTIKAGDMANVLGYLSFEEIADPKKTPAELGLDKPDVLVVKNRKGQVYTLKAGNSPSTNSTARYATLSAAYEPPAAPAPTNAPAPAATNETASAASANATAAATSTNAPAATAKDPQAEERERLANEVKTFNEKVGGWTYLLPATKTASLKFTRADLVKPKPVDTNAPASAVTAPMPVSVPPPPVTLAPEPAPAEPPPAPAAK